MNLVLLILACCGTIVIGRIVFSSWYNHLSLYAIVWGGSLFLFELRLIQYYPLEIETWLLIGAAWIAFCLGSLTIPSVRFALGQRQQAQDAAVVAENRDTEIVPLRRILWIFNTITVIHAVYQVVLSLNFMGGLQNLLIWGNVLYSYRVSQDIPGTIPYIGHFALSASMLGGIYTSRIGKIRLVAILPMLVVMVEAVANMGRATMIIAAVLFLTGLLVNKLREGISRSYLWRDSIRRYLTFGIGIIILAMGAELVRSVRVTNESFSGETSSLRKLRSAKFITPSIYLYATVHHGVFNQFLKKDEEHNRLFGQYTLAPFWRLLSKFGFETFVNPYYRNYLTPAGANTGTYLREIECDYGLTGVVLVPWLLGFVCSLLWFRIRAKGGITALIVLGHLYVVIAMSIFLMATQYGYWAVSLVVAVIVGYFFIDRKRKPAPAPL